MNLITQARRLKKVKMKQNHPSESAKIKESQGHSVTENSAKVPFHEDFPSFSLNSGTGNKNWDTSRSLTGFCKTISSGS
jgi:hypothetical protein